MTKFKTSLVPTDEVDTIKKGLLYSRKNKEFNKKLLIEYINYYGVDGRRKIRIIISKGENIKNGIVIYKDKVYLFKFDFIEIKDISDINKIEIKEITL